MKSYNTPPENQPSIIYVQVMLNWISSYMQFICLESVKPCYWFGQADQDTKLFVLSSEGGRIDPLLANSQQMNAVCEMDFNLSTSL